MISVIFNLQIIIVQKEMGDWGFCIFIFQYYLISQDQFLYLTQHSKGQKLHFQCKHFPLESLSMGNLRDLQQKNQLFYNLNKK